MTVQMMSVAGNRYECSGSTRVFSAYVLLPTTPSRAYDMGMPLQGTEWTLEMVHALPDDGNRYELIDGELYVTSAPAFVHQRALARLYRLLAPYAEAIGIDLLFAPAAVTFSKRRELQPDLFAIPRKADGRLAEKFADVGRLLLAVEILSPSTMRTDRKIKRPVYQQESVPEYWITNTSARTIERWTPTAPMSEILTTAMTWQPLPTHAALHLDVEQYFRNVYDE